MVFSRFIWSILAFAAAIVLTAIGLGIYLQKPEYPVTNSLFVLALILETAALLWYLTRIRRDLLKLIHALVNEDPSMQFSRVHRDPYFNAIHAGFNSLISDFRLVRLDREAEQRFFEETVNHVQFGLVAFNEKGQVKMVNRAFLDLFALSGIKHLDALKEISTELPDFFKQFSPGKEKLKKITLPDGQHHLIFLASGFVLIGENISLISVRDISREMDRNELEAWQKLLRVMRHEILNSISPIQLIAGNLSKRLQPEGELVSLERLTAEEVLDIKTGLDTIHRRASGLSVFLDAYANMYRTPEFTPVPTEIEPLLKRIAQLFKGDAEKHETSITVDCPIGELELSMDAKMVEQVLINLVKNAMEAVKGRSSRAITLYARTEQKEVILSVKDTGSGIPQDQMESIFVPFFSTRESGTGIGLSFSQHIMRMHGGQIRVSSIPGKGSEFQLIFGSRNTI
ncbi:MAG: GHKL domain-containing protein [Bacteroidales bacterium]|nr:GHKL domain-containing protein [Bacteroidales bacterium]